MRSALVDNPFADLACDLDDGVQLVQLTPERVMGQGISGGDAHPFRTVEEAVTFAMEHLSESERDLAFIQTGAGPIQRTDIERMYRSMQDGRSAPDSAGAQCNGRETQSGEAL
jgi:hypothetical protein